jgi:hypothetical protein
MIMQLSALSWSKMTTHKLEVEMRLCWPGNNGSGEWTDCNFVVIDASEEMSDEQIKQLAVAASEKKYQADDHIVSYYSWDECVCHEYHSDDCDCRCCL